MIKTVILDWAGTTVDFGCMAPVHAFKNAFLEKNIQLTDKEIREPMGKLKLDHIHQLFALPSVQKQWLKLYHELPQEKDANELYTQFERFLFEDLANYASLKPDTLPAIDRLKSEGLSIGTTTGYTREMMDIVAKTAESFGYTPDFLVTPDETEGLGRPYPYMIFKNMQFFQSRSVKEVIKVGDTAADIKEGKNAGLFTVGVIDGSSAMGLSYEEYKALDTEELNRLRSFVSREFHDAGADLCVNNLEELADFILEANQ
ncbi:MULTISPECIES: phosphonoacetaldehyde hydrolase [unclassified Enterococcus]|uniref:phosphonoacetaldehyde hydrolase n=1 Tax=unclassified Enterococcus TaxID=2608891 RepID=UPI0013EA274C|nr:MULTISPECIES: phosphonoacetaldehyde hydrolase [unclassified Enterococcus]